MDVLIFSIDSGYFGIPVKYVQEIMTAESTTAIPNAVKYIEGTFAPRDAIITVVNLRAYLEGSQQGTGVFIVIDVGDKEVALHIDSVVTTLNVQEVVEADAMMKCGEYPVIESAFKYDDHIVLNLDINRILAHIFDDKEDK